MSSLPRAVRISPLILVPLPLLPFWSCLFACLLCAASEPLEPPMSGTLGTPPSIMKPTRTWTPVAPPNIGLPAEYRETKT